MKKFLVPMLAGSMSLAGPTLVAASPPTVSPPQVQQNRSGNMQNSSGELQDAVNDLREARTVAQKMLGQQEARQLLDRAKGVVLVPDYGKGSLGVGASGGHGLLFARENGKWMGPVYYNIGSLSVGIQAGGAAGQVAMLLMSDRAVNSFKGTTTFSLDANAGLTVINYSAASQASLGKGDVVMWTDLEGASAGVSVGASAIAPDEDANRALYGSANASPSAILAGTVTANRQEITMLKNVLPSATAR